MKSNSNTYIGIAALLLALAVGLGAFGAHGLKEFLEQSNRAETFETAVKYHFYHGLGLLLLGILIKMGWEKLILSAKLMLGGIFIFSGSLYLLCFTGIGVLGAITPIGGVLLIAAWLILAYRAFKGDE